MKTQKATHLIKHEILTEHEMCVVGKAYCGAEVMWPTLKFTKVNVCRSCQRIYDNKPQLTKPVAKLHRWARDFSNKQH